ncbi:uncharacterized protein [Ptychodera flava]|uniref:uncharacterized protein n=1 Tax=Ptychodera flava TaxID=63121 RepID=UPI003969FE00
MAPIEMKYVVSFSSQDSQHRAENLLSQASGWRKWLSAKEDRSGNLEAEFQLEKISKIGYIDIGNYGSAFVEIWVGRASWSRDKEYVCLLPATSLMNIMDCKLGKNKHNVKMLNKDHLSVDATTEEWDRVRVICRQPYRKDCQFGLSFLRLRTPEESKDTDVGSPVTTKVSSPSVMRSGSKMKMASPTWKTDSSFYRKALITDESPQTSKVKAKLLKISGSSDVATEHSNSFSRTHRMIMAAATVKTMKMATTPTTGKDGNKNALKRGHSEHSKNGTDTEGKKTKQLFTKTSASPGMDDINAAETKECMTKFLRSLNFSEIDADTMTYADLRRQYESRCNRKLSKEEKRIFIDIAQVFVAETLECSQGKELNSMCSPAASKCTNSYNGDTPYFADSRSQVGSNNSKESTGSRTNRNEHCMETPEGASTPRHRGRGRGRGSSRGRGRGNSNTRGREKPENTDFTPGNSKRGRGKGKRGRGRRGRGGTATVLYPEPWPSNCIEASDNDRLDVSNLSDSDDDTQCPICSGLYSKTLIEAHAAMCIGDSLIMDSNDNYQPLTHHPVTSHRGNQSITTQSVDLMLCPLCQQEFSADQIEEHCDRCASRDDMFSDNYIPSEYYSMALH